MFVGGGGKGFFNELPVSTPVKKEFQLSEIPTYDPFCKRKYSSTVKIIPTPSRKRTGD